MHTVYVVINSETGEYVYGKIPELEDKTGISRTRIVWHASMGIPYGDYIIMYAKDCDFI